MAFSVTNGHAPQAADCGVLAIRATKNGHFPIHRVAKLSVWVCSSIYVLELWVLRHIGSVDNRAPVGCCLFASVQTLRLFIPHGWAEKSVAFVTVHGHVSDSLVAWRVITCSVPVTFPQFQYFASVWHCSSLSGKSTSILTFDHARSAMIPYCV